MKKLFALAAVALNSVRPADRLRQQNRNCQ